MKSYRRFFDCGYINYSNSVVKNKVTAEVILMSNGFIVAYLHIWSCNKKSKLDGGECFDEYKDKIHNPIFDTIYALWKRWNENDRKAGLLVQEKALERAGLANAYFDVKMKYLQSIGLFEVPISKWNKRREIVPSYIKGDTYRFGDAWIKQFIPRRELTAIRKLLKGEHACMTEEEALA